MSFMREVGGSAKTLWSNGDDEGGWTVWSATRHMLSITTLRTNTYILHSIANSDIKHSVAT